MMLDIRQGLYSKVVNGIFIQKHRSEHIKAELLVHVSDSSP